MLAVVVSRADSASEHIGEHLLEGRDWDVREDGRRSDAEGGGTYYRTEGIELRTFDGLHLHLERPADAFETEPDLLVFASRHSGETGALLTGHFTGNFGPAEFGGEDRALAAAAPHALARLIAAFDEHAPAGYDVGMECTHHGPTDVGAPSLFAELGSDEEQWADPAGAAAVARSILALEGMSPSRTTGADRDDRGDRGDRHDRGDPGGPGDRHNRDDRDGQDEDDSDPRQIVGFGGNHYAPRFERVVRETPWAVGHVASDWALEAMGDPRENEPLLERAFAASGADIALVAGDRPILEATLEDLGRRVVSETWLREVDDRPLAVVEWVERELGRIDASADDDGDGGVRFGRVNAESPDAITDVDLPTEVLAEAAGIDPDRAWQTVAEHTVAFATTNGGSRVGDRAVLADGDTLEAIVADLADVLREKYDEVAVEDDAVVVRREAFDPERAREAGVPEGPKFGRLADGESVTVDGETVAPETVRVDRTASFEI